ncbi:MAG: methyltransferase domain-containing protein [Spiribacter salinus]|uniref:Methyltransferase domain-containing protein n=1 Tax=Spiribacter salinus TaxID=1335746 RepID=A0A540VTP4_9GAMM|nr:MAG: methyltransferase domain-containing protein [Spiribacter salinus]
MSRRRAQNDAPQDDAREMSRQADADAPVPHANDAETASEGAEPMPPVFMFGFERSGTTLLSMMVGAHPQIAVPLSVTGLWIHYGQRLDDYRHLATAEDLQRLVDDLLAEERIRLWDAELDRDFILAGLPLGDYGAVIVRFHEAYARSKGKPYWANLDIATLDDMDAVHAWCPQARFVHIVRDGRDIALSHRTMPFGASNTLDCAERWQSRLHTSLKMGAVLGPERYHVVRFEDLVLDSEATLRRLCEFLGVPYSPAMLDYGHAVADKVPDDRRWLWPDLDKAPQQQNVYRWRQTMRPAQRALIERTAGDMLRELGYETYPAIPRSPTSYLMEGLCLVDRGGRIRRLRRRLGLAGRSKLERRWAARRPEDSGEATQTQAFGQLVRSGVFDSGFRHAEPQREFFSRVCGEALERLPSREPVRVLECGCGSGAWLECLGSLAPTGKLALYGFDLTAEMVDVTRERLAETTPPERIRRGDILDPAAYAFDEAADGFDLIVAYDVVQQLPRQRQAEACRRMLAHLRPGGVALIFDHERWSRYGMRMGWRKAATRYLGLHLVPRYYCNAHYPALNRIASRLGSEAGMRIRMHADAEGRKRALELQAALRDAEPKTAPNG